MAKEKKKNCLLKWFNKQPDDVFPKTEGHSYKDRLADVEKGIEPILKMIGPCASARDGGVLNDHGPDHVAMVIERASCLLTSPSGVFPQITPFETYLLLVAIHFHDAGNIFGREEHAETAKKIIDQLGIFLGGDRFEMKVIRDIVKSHATPKNGNRDTISLLTKEDHFKYELVRFQMLAAILKFADELADDYSRASKSMIEMNAIPKESEIYHYYSKSLHTVIIDAFKHSITLGFCFTKDEAQKKFQKGTEQRYLQDEIIERSLKMFSEMKYCMRFMVGISYFDTIFVSIKIHDDECNEIVPPMSYTLTDEGYPSTDQAHFSSLQNNIKTGEQLDSFLRSGDM